MFRIFGFWREEYDLKKIPFFLSIIIGGVRSPLDMVLWKIIVINIQRVTSPQREQRV